jgi:phospholipid/cholesterol/gamma-HCH transport system ATP-binding protein
MADALIRFIHVQKHFGSKVVFEDLTLDVLRGEVLTIMGPSGCGKSVMLKMLIGLLPIDSGEILYEGKSVAKMKDRDLVDMRRHVAYLFQASALFDSMSVGDNVAYGLHEQYWNKMSKQEIAERVERSLELVGLPGTQAMAPADLSGGMRKRVALARTLALQPQVILYDEPNTGLDPVNTERINELIRHIQKTLKVTSIVVTHDLRTIFGVSDRVALLYKGCVEFNGTLDDLKTTQNATVKQFVEGRVAAYEDVRTLLSG